MTPLLIIDTKTLLVRRIVNRRMSPAVRMVPENTPGDIESYRVNGRGQAAAPRADCGHKGPPTYVQD